MHVVIVGAGIMGLATAWSLVKRGHRVTVLEQAAEIPSGLAASGDQHRMIRRAYGVQGGYAELITEAYDAWDELWADLGARHYVEAGILNICQYAGDEADLFRAGFDAAGTSYERLTPDTAAARYPFLDPAGFQYAFFTPEGGALLCRQIAQGLVRWLEAHGAELRTGAEVVDLDTDGARVTLADGGTIAADRVVVTAGAWTLRLLPELADRLTVYRTGLIYVDPPADLAAAWSRAPAILSIGGPSEGYVLPPVAGTGLKFGAGFMKRPATDPEANRTRQPGEGERLLAAFAPPLANIERYRIRDVVTCAYTYTEDRTFFAQAAGRTLAISACSGHAYKFGAAVGRQVAAAVDGGDSERLRRWLRAEPAA